MSRTAVKNLLTQHGLTANKRLGQNFLTDSHVLQKIIRTAAPGAEDAVLEIGPGLGVLTGELAKTAGLVHAVEKDKKLAAILRGLFGESPNVEIAEADILEYPLAEYFARHEKYRHKVCANLPYYITTPIVMNLLENFGSRLTSITVMVQKEVAQRMAARPKQPEYGALSLAVQYYADAEIAAYVPANCFFPRPDVASAVVHLTILPSPRIAADTGIFRIIRAGFGKRRKILANALYSADLDFSPTLSKQEIAAAIDVCGFARGSAHLRAEELSLEDWAVLYKVLQKHYNHGKYFPQRRPI